MNFLKTKRSYLVALFMMLFANIASAEGFEKAKTLLTKVESGLTGLSVVTVTLACLWVGYKVLFGGSTLRETSPIIIGAIIIAGAAEVAKLLVQ